MSDKQRRQVLRNKAYGKKFEADLVKQAIKAGLDAKRAWGSNGQSLGEHPSVDMVINREKFQCKTKKNLPAWLGYDADIVDGVIFKTLRGQPMVLIPYVDYLTLLYTRSPEKQLGGLTPMKEE
jgi:Holliday junction resolvase